MADLPILPIDSANRPDGLEGRSRRDFYSFAEFTATCRRRAGILSGIVCGSLLICFLYNMVAPRMYEATSRVALRMQAASSLSIEGAQPLAPASILSTPLQLETMVDIFKSDRLAWQVLTAMKLHQSNAFAPGFPQRFAGFDPLKPSPEAQAFLLDSFSKHLKVRALPRTLLIQIDFQSRDPALSAEVVNTLLREYSAQERQGRSEATSQDTGWLGEQLSGLNAQVEKKEKQLAEFERAHSFLSTQQSTQDGQPIDTLRDPTVQQVEEVGRLLAAATGDRIMREALYREAQTGDPELVLAANPELQAEMGPGGASLVQQLRSRSSEMSLERAQLSAEHGPNFPRVLELDRALSDSSKQITVQDGNLLEAFRRSWSSAVNREQLLHRQLEDRMTQGLRQNDALLQYSVLHEEVVSERSLCSRMQTRIREAALASGVHGSSITVVDSARVPFKPVSPNWVMNFAVTLLLGIFVALGAAYWMDRSRPSFFSGGL